MAVSKKAMQERRDRVTSVGNRQPVKTSGVNLNQAVKDAAKVKGGFPGVLKDTSDNPKVKKPLPPPLPHEKSRIKPLNLSKDAKAIKVRQEAEKAGGLRRGRSK